MIKLRISRGFDKSNTPEPFDSIVLSSGNVYSIIGKTGSGKTQLIEDIESIADGDGITKRTIQVSGDPFNIAHLSQNMNFVLDLTVRDFIKLRLKSMKDSQEAINDFLKTANELCGEKILESDLLTQLSGGQSRSLMIADIAYNPNAGIILIDEIENAGIDKVKALSLLIQHKKLIIVITHDPLLALYGNKRILMQNGAIHKLIDRSDHELQMVNVLYKQHLEFEAIRDNLRKGYSLI
ncbi:ATP-binding cassette domain-containing protein [Fusibacter sp. 3D3]|uniref:ATP-binding cassette domain-containing protein n=1 Tax=Fusibacter sp. 3D3 TaxID=1048380 RepID=UPI0008532B18|nr:ATP-binding cassette domain-containing protein [Fusibacter sp. 3D3]GAU78865.1 uncharacterized ABC transporter ATP-binding protein MJ0121 [Fusibacter sp. 3D3]